MSNERFQSTIFCDILCMLCFCLHCWSDLRSCTTFGRSFCVTYVLIDVAQLPKMDKSECAPLICCASIHQATIGPKTIRTLMAAHVERMYIVPGCHCSNAVSFAAG